MPSQPRRPSRSLASPRAVAATATSAGLVASSTAVTPEEIVCCPAAISQNGTARFTAPNRNAVRGRRRINVSDGASTWGRTASNASTPPATRIQDSSPGS